MVHIHWKDRYNINYKEIDEQHKVLLGILNDLADLVEAQCDVDQVTRIFHRLFDYTQIHFATEEGYLRKARWVGLLAHIGEHATFSRKLLELNQRYDPANPKLVEETLAFLRGWYLNHITDMDMQYVPHLNAMRGKLPVRAVLMAWEGVLGTFDPSGFANRLGELSGKAPGEFAQALSAPGGPLRDFESGRIDPEAFESRISELFGAELDPSALAEAYTGGWSPNPEVANLLHALKPKFKLGLVCETGPWRLEKVLQPSPEFPLFDTVALSFEMKALGPSPFLLRHLLDKLDLIAEECVYLDPRGACVEEASGERFRAVKFTSAQGLAKELKAMNLEW